MRLLAVVLALWSLGAAAYPLCDSLEKYQAFNRSMDPWWKVLEEKRYAEDVVEHVMGVRDVNNHLKVTRPDQVIGTARSGASSPLALSDTPPPPPQPRK